ncbi:hypothetical protein B296_00052268 [Ensete ventricosum]|uniref:Uncharacterized protein n=1 Tax=Ensete ventricosum TaxID=4639 RepID=A0A426WZE8_ENSVE|nr:hypothetical protein B296_00052268 [Ensete ventricosum]
MPIQIKNRDVTVHSMNYLMRWRRMKHRGGNRRRRRRPRDHQHLGGLLSNPHRSLPPSKSPAKSDFERGRKLSQSGVRPRPRRLSLASRRVQATNPFVGATRIASFANYGKAILRSRTAKTGHRLCFDLLSSDEQQAA